MNAYVDAHVVTTDDWGLAAGPQQQFVAINGVPRQASPAPAGSQLGILFTADTTSSSAVATGGVASQTDGVLFIVLTLDGSPGDVTVTWNTSQNIPGFTQVPDQTCKINIPGQASLSCPAGTIPNPAADFGGAPCISIGGGSGGGGGGAKGIGPTNSTSASSTGTVVAAIAAAAALGGAAWYFLR